MERFRSAGDRCRVYSEYHTRRPTLPQAVYDDFGFAPGDRVVLVGNGADVELYSEAEWDTIMADASNSIDGAVEPGQLS